MALTADSTPASLAPITVLTFGSAGDVHPLAGLALRLQQRGHPVQLLCGRLHVPMVQRLGLHAVAVDTAPMPAMAVHRSPLFKAPAMWRRVEQALHASLQHVQAQVATLPAGAPRPVLVASTFALAGRVLQEVLGLRLATVHLSPACIGSAHAPPRIGDLVTPAWLPLQVRQALWWALERALFDPVVAPELNALRARLGLPPAQRVLSRWLHSPEQVLGLFPPWLAAPQPDWPAHTRLLGFPLFDPPAAPAATGRAVADGDPGPHAAAASSDGLDAELQAFLAAGPPPLACYPSSAGRDASVFFDRVLALGAHLGRRVLLLTRYREQVAGGGPLPPWALHRAYVPFARLLPHCAALLHVGGMGASAQALAAGLPQLLLPHHFDQFDNAQRLQQLGVARWHRGGSPVPPLATSLQHLLTDPATAQACARWQRQMQQDARVDALGAAASAVQALAAAPPGTT